MGGPILRVLTLLAVAGGMLLACATASAQTPPAISVSGNQLVAGGKPVVLHGVNRGAYTQCDFGVYDHYNNTTDDYADGPVDQTSINAMASWGINVVRLPISESCWLGLAGQPTASNGATATQYRQAVQNYVNLLGQNGLYVIVSLYSTAPSGAYASSAVDTLPDEANAPAFWTSVAQTFGSDGWVMFDLLNEAAISLYNGTGTTEDQMWNCWLNGCTTHSIVDSSHGTPVSYQSAGMQQLLRDVRAQDTSTPVILGSPDYDFDKAEWSTHAPTDAGGSADTQLVYDVHLYDFSFTGDTTVAESKTDIAAAETDAKNELDAVIPIAQTAPVMIGELGELDCNDPASPGQFVPAVLHDVDQYAADGISLSVLGWTWDADTDHGTTPALTHGMEQCPANADIGGPNLITDYDGTPTTMGQALKTWFLGGDPVPVDSVAPTVTDAHTPPWVAGDTVTANPGIWSGLPSAYTYQWLDCSTAQNCTAIPGAAGATYTLTAGEEGHTVEVLVSGVNGSGSGQAMSAMTGTVIEPVPVNQTAPSVAGSSAVGGTLTCSPGTWSAADAKYSYAWYAGAAVQADAGSTITVGTQYDGLTLTCTVAASDAAGSSAPVTSSNGVAIPAAAPTNIQTPLQTLSDPAPTPAVTSASVALSCPRQGAGACRFHLALVDGKKTIGSASVKVKPGKRKTAVIRLNAAGRKLLAKRGSLSGKLTVTEGAGMSPKVVLRRTEHFAAAGS